MSEQKMERDERDEWSHWRALAETGGKITIPAPALLRLIDVARKPSVDDVMAIRCMLHRNVTQENTNAAGAECAVCMADAHVAAYSTPPEAAGLNETQKWEAVMLGDIHISESPEAAGRGGTPMPETPKSFEQCHNNCVLLAGHTGDCAMGSLPPQTAPGWGEWVHVEIKRPDEGYEDVCDELVAEDALKDIGRRGWVWRIAAARQAASPEKEKETEMSEQPVFTLLFRRAELMPDGSIGAVFIGECGGDRSKDLRLTVAQAQTLADQITQKVGNHTIFEQGAPHAGK